jgi:phytoene desaturase
MYGIVEGLLNELDKAGVEVIYNTEITSFEKEGNKLKSLADSKGKKWESDISVINSDAAVFRGSVLRKPAYSLKKLDKKNWTMGYLTFYIGLNKKLPQVHHHNYYLGSNYEEYAHNVLRNPSTLEKPYYYVNVLSKYNDDCAPSGCESLFFVCPVPNLLYKDNWDDRDQIVNSILEDFSGRIGEDISGNVISRTVYTPYEWQERFNLHRGSGLGLSHSMMQIGALRPSNFDEDYNNVFYVGASTVPGAGLPMAIISSQLVTERILNHTDKPDS